VGDVDITDLADLGQVVAGIASVASLIFVAWQMRALAVQTREAANQSRAAAAATRAAVYTATAGFAIDMDKFLVDRPEIRAVLYGPLDGARDETAQREAAAAEMMIDLFEALLANSEHLGDDMSDGWYAYICHVFQRSPALQSFWQANRNWYGTETRVLLDRACSVLRPAVPAEDAASVTA
jgi:hypothetical protein